MTAPLDVNTITTLSGTYEGSGSWHDAAGKSAGYRIRQTNVTTDHGFTVTFKHDFDDGSVVEASFDMVWIAPFVFRLDMAGTPVGNGYVFEGYCHYHMKVGEAFVEASYRADGDRVEVYGSSTKNVEGNYIAWRERLRRASPDEG